MGKQNRQRRAAKQRKRRRDGRAVPPRARGWSDDAPPLGPRERTAGLWWLATRHTRVGAHADAREAVLALAHLDPGVVTDTGEQLLVEHVATLWEHGWQPGELHRQIRRTASAPAARLVLHAIAADNAERPATSVDPRWIAQLDALELPRASGNGWLRRFAASQPIAWPAAIGVAVELANCLAATGPIPIVLPPPGHTDDDSIDLTSPVDDPILARVRALLAQAESTTFEAEAETFTAKAQELMTRHAIDEALLDAGARRGDDPITLRIPIDDPYADAKSLLAQVVAEQSRCRCVFHDRYSLSSIVGFAHDVAAAEMLFTSLLVQASTALRAAAAGAPAGARPRSRGFRSAFWLAYAHRVGDRLAEINERLVGTADRESGGELLPVLSMRSARVDAAVESLFGKLGVQRVRGGYDLAGWVSGITAADVAQLTAGSITDGTPRQLPLG
jgi:hypothetical protein